MTRQRRPPRPQTLLSHKEAAQKIATDIERLHDLRAKEPSRRANFIGSLTIRDRISIFMKEKKEQMVAAAIQAVLRQLLKLTLEDAMGDKKEQIITPARVTGAVLMVIATVGWELSEELAGHIASAVSGLTGALILWWKGRTGKDTQEESHD